MKRLLAASFIPLLFVFPTQAQQVNDTTFVAAAKDRAVEFYTKTIGIQSGLFEGSEYKEYVAQRDEFPYMHDDVMYGDVKYNGEVYKNVPLYFDLEKDQIITAYPHGNKVQLLREKVEYFDIDGHRFVLLRGKKVNEGFYDLLYDGKMKFYARRQKVAVLKVNSNGGDPTRTFDEKSRYFILKGEVYHLVQSKRSVLALLNDKKRELNRMMRAEGLKFKRYREKAIAIMLTRYEQIK